MPILTPDRRYIVVRDRLWRASNPDIPDATHKSLTHALMDARRAVRTARRTSDRESESRARSRVHAAKVALGERGPVWWTDGAPDLNRRRIENTPYRDWWQVMTTIRSTIIQMLSDRNPDATICPSEVARSIQAAGWRALMPDVREAARELAREGHVTVMQKGKPLPPEAEWRGPIRIGRAGAERIARTPS